VRCVGYKFQLKCKVVFGVNGEARGEKLAHLCELRIRHEDSGSAPG
jgi:hypothetical protein